MSTVTISRTQALNDDTMTIRDVPYDQVVRTDDPDQIIHVPASEIDELVKYCIGIFEYTLAEIGLGVSTGRVVDFRANESLRPGLGPRPRPLIYPAHFSNGVVRWPNQERKKPKADFSSSATKVSMLPSGYYVLVKRFSAKEEPRRVVAALFDPETGLRAARGL